MQGILPTGSVAMKDDKHFLHVTLLAAAVRPIGRAIQASIEKTLAGGPVPSNNRQPTPDPRNKHRQLHPCVGRILRRSPRSQASASLLFNNPRIGREQIRPLPVSPPLNRQEKQRGGKRGKIARQVPWGKKLS